MMSLLLALALAQHVVRPTQEQAISMERAFFDQVELSLSVDATSHYIGEPVRLRVTMRNNGTTPVLGYLTVAPYSGTTELSYRRPGGAFRRFVTHAIGEEEMNMLILPTVLEPEAEHTSEVLLAFDPELATPVLNEPGVYEFMAVYRGIATIRGKPIRSNVIAVTSVAPPSVHEDALKHYAASSLPQVAQFDPLTTILDQSAVSAAGEFVDRYPESPYTAGVRQGLLRYLTDRVSQQRATVEEKRLYDQYTGVQR
jgi:hypothetical protein